MKNSHGATLAVSASVGALIFGLSYLVAVPLIWKEIGGRGMNLALNFLAALSAALLLATGFAAHGLQFWLLPVSVVIGGGLRSPQSLH